MSNNPFFSIVVPTYNRPEELWQFLESLTKLDFPTDNFELIVVDDGSPIPLKHIVDAFKLQLHITYLRQDNAGPASARNYGARNASGQYLAFIDDDCQLARNWLSLMKATLLKKTDQMLGGKTINILKDNLYSSTSQFLVDIVYAHHNKDPNDARFFASNNMVVPTKIFHEIGGFPNYLRPGGEDRELCDRWTWKGYKMSYVEDAIIYHAHNLTLKKFCKQHFNYGVGAYLFQHSRKGRKTRNMAKEMKFHTNLNNWLLAPFTKKKKNPFAMFYLLVVWQVANFFGFIYGGLFERVK